MAPIDMKAGSEHVTKNYGTLTVVEYVNSAFVKVRFNDTGYETSSQANNIRSGKVRDLLVPSLFGVGFIGNGDHLATIKGKPTKAYSLWKGMIERCYSEVSLKNKPSYKDCTVCESWHNFQNFADWLASQDYAGKQLDKDIKSNENKVYSPETCMFVSQEENVRYSTKKVYEMISPDGELVVIDNMLKFCTDKKLDASCMVKVCKGKRTQHNGWELA